MPTTPTARRAWSAGSDSCTKTSIATGPLSDEQIAAVRGDFATYADRHGIDANQVGAEIGFSGRDINRFRSRIYDENAEKIARALNGWIERHARRKLIDLPMSYVPTRLAEDIRAVAYAAIELCSMAAIVCPSGSGKTMVLKVLANETRGHYFYCDGDMSPSMTLRELARSIGARCTGTQGEIKRSIIQKLDGTNRPILLDEAQQMPTSILAGMRSIYDQAEVPIIMAGSAEILDRIDDRAGGRGQMSGRCLRYNALEHVFNAGDPGGGSMGRPLFSREEVEQFFCQMQVRIDPDAFDLLWAIACLPNQSCLRTVRRIVQLIVKKFQVDVVSRQDVVDALPLQLGELGRQVVRQADRHRQAMQTKDLKRKSA